MSAEECLREARKRKHDADRTRVSQLFGVGVASGCGLFGKWVWLFKTVGVAFGDSTYSQFVQKKG